MNRTRRAKMQASSPNVLAQQHRSMVFVIKLWSPSRVLTTSAKMESHMCQNMAFTRPLWSPPPCTKGQHPLARLTLFTV